MTLSLISTATFLFFFILSARTAYQYNKQYFIKIRELEAAYAKAGRKWSYWLDINFRSKILLSPESALDSTDSVDIAAKKEGLIGVRKTLKVYLRKGIILLAGGVVAAVLVPVILLNVFKLFGVLLKLARSKNGYPETPWVKAMTQRCTRMRGIAQLAWSIHLAYGVEVW